MGMMMNTEVHEIWVRKMKTNDRSSCRKHVVSQLSPSLTTSQWAGKHPVTQYASSGKSWPRPTFDRADNNAPEMLFLSIFWDSMNRMNAGLSFDLNADGTSSSNSMFAPLHILSANTSKELAHSREVIGARNASRNNGKRNKNSLTKANRIVSEWLYLDCVRLFSMSTIFFAIQLQTKENAKITPVCTRATSAGGRMAMARANVTPMKIRRKATVIAFPSTE
mmetsp:Transcript_29680/g.86110  ORF Transcript_29680/g.86110 Transcript_29680/m.86110 type:complete len:222 (+) Transcript_29680:667-1332(+)